MHGLAVMARQVFLACICTYEILYTIAWFSLFSTDLTGKMGRPRLDVGWAAPMHIYLYRLVQWNHPSIHPLISS